MDWLVTSIVLSVLLTLALNLGIRAFPGAGDRAARRLDELARPRSADSQTRVWFPWRGMLIASVALTVVLNLAMWLL